MLIGRKTTKDIVAILFNNRTQVGYEGIILDVLNEIIINRTMVNIRNHVRKDRKCQNSITKHY